MTRRGLLSTLVTAMVGATGSDARGGRAPAVALVAQSGYVTGVFVNTARGPVELIAYADRIGNGQLRMSFGTFEDVPAIASPSRLLCNLPNWKPVLVWLSTRRIFKDEFAERRTIPFAGRPLNIAALELRIAEMEDAARLQKLLAAVGASESNPGYLFVTLNNGSISREYMIELMRD